MAEDFFQRIAKRIKGRPWYEKPRLFAMGDLLEIRNELREKNLHDTEEPPLKAQNPASVPARERGRRTTEGVNNDLRFREMGAAGRRFGRNFPLRHVVPDTANLMKPSPRVVSRELMTRDEFQPVTILNLLAASWIQFMVHDWFVHKTSDAETADIPLARDDDWSDPSMTVKRTEPDPAPPGSKRPPAYVNLNSHWWDASQIYGADKGTARKLRTGEGGRLRIEPTGLLPVDPVSGIHLTGFTDNWWIGLAMLHTLFTLEHNHIADHVASQNPGWNDTQVFEKARLINAALMAKIHTIEWTPAILPHPVIQRGMHVNWSGLLSDDPALGLLDDSELLGGIIGSRADHHSAPYSLTEEFVAVYRMHPLMPDEFAFHSLATGRLIETRTLNDVVGQRVPDIAQRVSMPDLFYSFGVSHPGAIRLHNYPRTLQDLRRDDGEHMDLAAVDIFRDRERGVPRYNQFRRLLRKEPVTSFDQLSDNPEWRKQLRRVYRNDLEAVDLMTGLYAEPLPEGFGFSETAFRIFVLMASRRLKSDRFFTDDYRPEVYTEFGLDYIDRNTMLTVLLRHYPQLAPALAGVDNAFHPWKKTGAPPPP